MFPTTQDGCNLKGVDKTANMYSSTTPYKCLHQSLNIEQMYIALVCAQPASHFITIINQVVLGVYRLPVLLHQEK